MEAVVLTKGYLESLWSIYDLSGKEDKGYEEPLKPVRFGYYGAISAGRSENDQGDEVALRMDGSVMDPKSGKVYSGPIEEMEDYSKNQELQNTLKEVRDFIQEIWNKLED